MRRAPERDEAKCIFKGEFLLRRHSSLQLSSLWMRILPCILWMLCLQLVSPGQHEKCARPATGRVPYQGPSFASVENRVDAHRTFPLLISLRGGGIRGSPHVKEKTIRRKTHGPDQVLDRKTFTSRNKKGAVSIKEAFVSNLRAVSARKGTLEEYQRKYNEGKKPEGEAAKPGKAAHNPKIVQKDLSAASGISLAEKKLHNSAKSKRKFSSMGKEEDKQADLHEPDQSTATTKDTQQKNVTEFVWNASSVQSVLSELNRTGLCLHTDLDLRVRAFMTRLQKQGRKALVLQALRNFCDHLLRPVSESRRIRNKCAVLTRMLHTAVENAPNPIKKASSASHTPNGTDPADITDFYGQNQAPLPLVIGTRTCERSEEQVRWGTAMQVGVQITNDVDAIALENSTYMVKYPTVAGRRVFTNASAPIEVVMRVTKMSKMMFIGVLARNSSLQQTLISGLSTWWGAATMVNKAWYVVSNGRALNGGRLLSSGGTHFQENDLVIVRLELAQHRVTILKGNEDGSTGQTLMVFEDVTDAVRVAVQFKEERDSVRLLVTRPYVPPQDVTAGQADGATALVNDDMADDEKRGKISGGTGGVGAKNETRCVYVCVSVRGESVFLGALWWCVYRLYVRTYMHTCMYYVYVEIMQTTYHACIHTYHTYMHICIYYKHVEIMYTCIHACTHIMHTYIHTYIHTCLFLPMSDCCQPFLHVQTIHTYS
jgi:hypothetical protein